MNFELIARIILVVINAFGILLAWWVIESGSNRKLKVWFFFMTLFMLLWANFSYFGSRIENPDISVLLYRLNWSAVSLFLSTFYYFFVVYFLERGKLAKYIGVVLVFVSLAFFSLSIFTDQVISEVIQRDWGNEVVFGQFGDLFNIFSAVVAIIIIVYSLSVYKSSTKEMRSKLRYFIFGVFIFIAANLIFNVGLQIFFESVQYQFLGDFSSIILLSCTAYATIQHRLFDVKVIATEAVTAILIVVLLSRIFVSQTTTGKVIDAAVFLIALGFGYLLVRSVSREIAQRELLQDLNKRLEDLDKQKDEFLNVASHELRAPMTAVKGYINMTQDGDGGQIPTEAQDLLKEASTEADRMIRLVNNMLNVARIEEGRMVFEEGETNLSDVVKRVFNEFKFEADNKGLKYSYEQAEHLRDRVLVDVDRIHEVVANLINNAIKYTDEGQVVVNLSNPDPTKIRFEVVDTGVGMTQDEVGKLFQKFYRAESYIGKKMGTGLGLYISKLLVKKFGGEIGVTSEKGKGSTFWFELPVKV